MDEIKKETPIIIEEDGYSGEDLENIFFAFDWEDDEEARNELYKYMDGMWYIQVTIVENTHWQPHTEQEIFPKEKEDFELIKN